MVRWVELRFVRFYCVQFGSVRLIHFGIGFKAYPARKGRKENVMLRNDLIQELSEKISKMDYGSIIKHSEIAKKLLCEVDTPKYRSHVQKLKSLCLEKSKMLKSVLKIGYKIVYPDNYTDEAVGEFRRAQRRIRQAESIMAFSPLKDMSELERQRHRNISDRIIIATAHMKGAVVELVHLNNQKAIKMSEDKDKKDGFDFFKSDLYTKHH